MQIGRRWLAILVSVVALCTGFDALAGVRATSADARVVIPSQILPESLETGEWSLLVWIYADEAVDRPCSVLSIDGHLSVVATPDGLTVRMAHRHYAAEAKLDTPLEAGRWHMLAVSMEHKARRMRAWLAVDREDATEADIASAMVRLRREGDARRFLRDRRQAGEPRIGPRAGLALLELTTSMPLEPDPSLSYDIDGLIVGSSNGLPAPLLTYESLAIRDHAIRVEDVRAVWQSRDSYAPHSLDATDDGGWLNGWRGCSFLAFHAMSPRANGPGEAEEVASFVGGAVLPTNVIILAQPRERTRSFSHSFMSVVPIRSARGFVFASRLEPRLDGFFAVETPPFDAPSDAIGPLGPKARMLATEPDGLVRVVVSANSRGVRGTLDPQPWPEGFAHGFVQALLPQVAGVMMRPPTIVDRRGGWFGLDTSESTPDVTLVRALHARTDQWGDWSRFGTGTLPAVSRGPGAASNISGGGAFRLRCGPVDGSLLRADAPLVVRSTVLAFPGSSTLRWTPERGSMQDGPGLELEPAREVPLDTTRDAIELTAGDRFVGDLQLVLDRVVDVREGDAIVVSSGPARGAVSVATAVEIIVGQTTITLSHPFGAQPGTGDQLRIGRWSFVSIEHRFDPVPAGDDRSWRGQILRAMDDELLGVMLYATSAWRPDVDGFIFGSAGQSGRGYEPQMEESFPGSLEAWANESLVDVWIQGLAQQSSRPSAMRDYLDVLRSGLDSDAEVIWASDAVHAHTAHEGWHHYLEENAADAGVPAIFAVGHPRVGSYFAQAASGMRTDDAHFSSFGSRVIAEAWLDQLRSLLDGPCDRADYNRDGTADIFDFLAFQSDWQDGDPRADLDDDGEFTIFDFLVLITAIDQCP
ncbi:Uncharacterized protein SCF082_LOCUS18879 [Durusdinium trenchii]|uniref:Uncharacterized protein n=1 Tax=Durusdinium trenchii TaxID=1381693 RepID=A0ABP0KTR9_9DINO